MDKLLIKIDNLSHFQHPRELPRKEHLCYAKQPRISVLRTRKLSAMSIRQIYLTFYQRIRMQKVAIPDIPSGISQKLALSIRD